MDHSKESKDPVTKADAHYKCSALTALLRAYLTTPVVGEQDIHLSNIEQAGLDEVFELLQQCLNKCKP